MGFGPLATLLLLFWRNGAPEQSKELMLFQSFSWQQFLVAALVFSLLWYVGVLFIFYRRELRAFFGGRGSPRGLEPLPHRWEKGVTEVGAIPSRSDDGAGGLDGEGGDSLMGESKLPEGMESMGMEGFGFVSDRSREDQVGLVPDVLSEIRQVFDSLAASDGNKKDFFRLMVSVAENYPKIASHPQIGGINSFISENAPFHISADELENIWH